MSLEQPRVWLAVNVGPSWLLQGGYTARHRIRTASQREVLMFKQAVTVMDRQRHIGNQLIDRIHHL